MERMTRTQARRKPRTTPNDARANALRERVSGISGRFTGLLRAQPNVIVRLSNISDSYYASQSTESMYAHGNKRRTEQDLSTYQDEEGRSLLDDVSDLLSGDKDVFWIAGLDPANYQRGNILAHDLQYHADGENSHGGIDRLDLEKREEAETRDEDSDGLHEVSCTELWQAPGVSEHECEPEEFGQEEERDCPFEGLVASVVHDKYTLFPL